LIIIDSAHTHVIPLDSMIAKQLSRLRPGQVVTLYGELVDGVREDTGAGACEVLLVSDVAFSPR
jgi:hypothetical protein